MRLELGRAALWVDEHQHAERLLVGARDGQRHHVLERQQRDERRAARRELGAIEGHRDTLHQGLPKERIVDARVGPREAIGERPARALDDELVVARVDQQDERQIGRVLRQRLLERAVERVGERARDRRGALDAEQELDLGGPLCRRSCVSKSSMLRDTRST